MEKVITRDDLLNACKNKVDNTGNVKIWPSEEYLANYLIKNSHLFEHKSICELGAGKSGLAGIALAIKLQSKIGEILISDGNDECWQSIIKNIQLNKEAIGENNVDRVVAKQIIWDPNFRSDKKYDYICMADWLFFREYQLALQYTLAELLQDSDEEGKVLIVGPNRSNTVSEFIDIIDEDEIFDYGIDAIDELIAKVDDFNEGDAMPTQKRNIASDNDFNLNDEDKYLLPELDNQEAGTNALMMDELDNINYNQD